MLREEADLGQGMTAGVEQTPELQQQFTSIMLKKDDLLKHISHLDTEINAKKVQLSKAK